MEKKYNVNGMTCASCQASIEKTISKLDGVNKCQVNLANNTMSIDYDEKILSEETIIASVKNDGYGLSKYERKDTSIIDKQSVELNKMKKRLIISFIFLIPLFYISMGHMLKFPLPSFITSMEGVNVIIFASIQLILVIPIIVVNWSYFNNGLRKLFKGNPNMDTLVAIGSVASFLYGLFAIIQIVIGVSTNNNELVKNYGMDLYFESSGTILTLVTLGKYLETKSKGRAHKTIEKLIKLTPKTAFVEEGNKVIEKLIEEVIINDILQIKSGMTIPVDGIIIEGSATIDEAMITGESLPVEKTIEDKVIGGTIIQTGFLRVVVKKTNSEGVLSQIIALVDEASNSKAPISQLVDRISLYFVPIVIGISLISLVINWLIYKDFVIALSMAISVLVISCPCALGLATPMAIMVGTQMGAENHILIKSSEAIELLSKTNIVALDKTGTITKGKLVVSDIVSIIETSDFNQIAYLLEQHSEHPIGQAIINYLSDKNISLTEKYQELNVLPGYGIIIKQNNNEYYAGNQALMLDKKINLDNIIDKVYELSKMGKTVVYLGKNNQLLGIIAVRDEVKEDSKKAIDELKNLGLKVAMLTGDFEVTAEAIKDELGIDYCYAQMSPIAKEQKIIELQANNQKVTMVGDGINDSIALIRSDVAIAIGAGTDIAIEAADIVLMRGELTDAVTAIRLSKAIMINIKMNLFWAFIYNIIGIPIAAGLFYGLFNLKLNPMIAALAMSCSSLCVVLNALRLRFFRSIRREKI